jgi:hypothetical protein
VGQADAGVASGAFDDRAARLEGAGGLSLQEDAEGCTILDRAPGVHELGLAEDRAPGQPAEGVEPDQGRVADSPHKSFGDAGVIGAHGQVCAWADGRHTRGLTLGSED